MRLEVDSCSLLVAHAAPSAPESPVRSSDSPSPAVRALLAMESAALFVGIPAAHYFGLLPVHPIAMAVAVGLFVGLVIFLDRRFDNRTLWNANRFGEQLTRVLALFIPAALVITTFVWTIAPERLFDLPRQQTWLWLTILLVYPILSVYPQEVIYRAFFFHRYKPVFGSGAAMVVASAVVFAFMHIMFKNSVAVGLTLVGGVVFALRYRATQSLLIASIEHALYGMLMFTVGLGKFFISGMAT